MGNSACTVSVARLVVAVVHLHDADAFWNATLNSELTCVLDSFPSAYGSVVFSEADIDAHTSVIEMNVGIIAACMTTLPAFFKESGIFDTATYDSLRSHLFSSLNRSKASKKDSSSDSSKTGQGRFADENSSHGRLHDINNSFDMRDMVTADAVAGGQGFAPHPEHAKGAIVRTVDYTVV